MVKNFRLITELSLLNTELCLSLACITDFVCDQMHHLNSALQFLLHSPNLLTASPKISMGSSSCFGGVTGRTQPLVWFQDQHPTAHLPIKGRGAFFIFVLHTGGYSQILIIFKVEVQRHRNSGVGTGEEVNVHFWRWEQ